ncbi:MAG: hypothetical protein P4L56_18170 [Candidatus Sulfopaludibacter sp.]|nr:hypothetical protein [Candidatus Sulfopaludibacter sp.]
MTIHSFMLADLEGSLLAVCLFPLFIVAPGFAVAWLTDLFDFRRRTTAFQCALSLPLSIALCPIATYFAGRFGSALAVWGLYALSWAYCLFLAGRHFRRGIALPKPRVALPILLGWTALAVFSLIDLQIGDRAWFPAAAFDYSVRTQFIQSIGDTGIPPANPFFLPGHAAPLRYHYFWLLLCNLVNRAGSPIVGARHAWIAGAVWCGIGLMAIVALYFRLFCYRGPASFPRRAIAGILLLGVGGLDILPTALLWALQAAGMHGVLPSMEWWNEQVDGFVFTTLWESHYLCGLIGCLMAFLLLWHSPRRSGSGLRPAYVIFAGLALASAGGASIYVAFVFGVFLGVWTVAALVQGRRQDAGAVIAAGVLALALILPYAASLRGPGSGGPMFQAWVRPFYPLDALYAGQSVGRAWVLPVANALVLPLNYFLELGLFFATGALWWKKHRAGGRRLSPAETATALMIATSVVICTFLRSSVIGNNDLGWRGFLIAQFGLLLWAVDVLCDRDTASRRDYRLLTALLVLGVAGSVYEVAINRFYPLLADRGTVNTVSWMASDRQAGKRIYAAREAGEWAEAATPRNAIVQFNPHVPTQDTEAFLYAGRRMIAGSDNCLSAFGGDPALCPPILRTLARIYSPAGQTEPALEGVCRSLPIDIIAVDDTDPVWKDRASWVWTRRPAFANSYVRLFRCPH